MTSQFVCSRAALPRISWAQSWLSRRDRGQKLWLVGADAGVGRELIRTVVRPGESAFGWQSGSLLDFATHLAGPEMGARGLNVASTSRLESICAAVISTVDARGEAGQYAGIADRPGFSRALVRSFSELRLAGLSDGKDQALAAELRLLYSEYRAALVEQGLVDTADLLRIATETIRAGVGPGDVLFIDAAAGSQEERHFIVETLRNSPDACVVMPSQEHVLRQALELGLEESFDELNTSAPGALGRLQDFLFTESSPPVSAADDTVLLFSAPGEDRECVEIVRRIQKAASEGTPYDRMAVLLRSESSHRAELEEAFRRGEVPVFYARGTSIPDPSSRAFLLLLSCRLEDLSVARFCEYLSLRQLGEEVHVASWERLLHDARAIGGIDRIVRRLEDHQDAHREEQLSLLKDQGISLLRTLSSLPSRDTWQGWGSRLAVLAGEGLLEPDGVYSVLRDLSARGTTGEAALAEVKILLSRRLGERRVAPEHRVHGAVFVGTTEDARGRSFARVYVPGLAEGVFPEKVVEDPVLLDDIRALISPALVTNRDRSFGERFSLQLAAGAAEQQLVLSWARLNAHAGRPRVPSFYALESIRAARGLLPSFEALAEEADNLGSARMGWPAPEDPNDAIDSAEHDLALFHRVRRRPESEARGTMRYLLGSNPHLGRSLRARARRWDLARYNPADGLVTPREQGLKAIANHGLKKRAYSPSSLESFAACPYRFLLSTIHGLRPRKVIGPLEYLDAATRGELIHSIQFSFLTQMRDLNLLPITRDRTAEVLVQLGRVIDEVAAEYADTLAPAIERVWLDALASIQADLREWLRRLAGDERWSPQYFELSFGLPDREGCDPASHPDPVRLDSGIVLRGSIDLVESEAEGGGALRVTDCKTGKARVSPGSIISGGGSLQPMLYALAAEKLFPDRSVEQGRLDYCTTRGQFQQVVVPLRDEGRRSIEDLALSLSARLDSGNFPAVPREGECERCDYLPVCGPHEEFRISRKNSSAIDDLIRLRGLR